MARLSIARQTPRARSFLQRSRVMGSRGPFIGRERELAALEQATSSAGLVTLTGPGGCGKTRLALEFTRRASDLATILVELGVVRSPDQVIDALLRAFDVRERGGRTQTEILLESVSERRALLVLDNCEHVRGEVARLAGELLGAGPGLRILITSREPVGLSGERVVAADPSPVTQSVASTLGSLQTQLYETIAPSGGQLTPSNDVANAATRLNGARALLDDYVELGLPNSLSDDPTLRSLVYGPDHLLDNNPTENEVYNDYQSWIASPPATDPAAPGGALEETMRSDAGALANQLTTDIAAAANSPDRETDSLISSTIPWLELTYSVLTAPKSKPAPPVPALKILKAPRVSGEKITVKFECLKAACKGAAAASTPAHVNKRTVVATHGYALRPNQTLAVTLSPNAAGRKLLSRHGKLTVAFTLTLAEPGGKTATVEHARLVLTAPKPKPKPKR